MERHFIPAIQVRSNALVYYEIPDPPFSHHRYQVRQHSTYSGTVTSHAAARIRRTVDVFLQKSPTRKIMNTATGQPNKFRLNFITLTIAQSKPVPTKEGHAGLKVFLQHFKAKPSKRAISEQLQSYIWKCELQERGQLHYHITTNRFLHWAEIQRIWNGIQFRRGWLNDFIAEHGHSNPNSTDVHAVYKVRDIQAYLSKYMSKTGRKDMSEYGYPQTIFEPSIDGKVWDCSNDLKVKRFSAELDTDTENKIRAGIKFQTVRAVDFERCKVFCTDNPSGLLSTHIKNQWEAWKK